MLCFSAARDESLESLRASLVATPPPREMPLVIGGAAVTPEVARELRATYAEEKLGLAVPQLRKLSRR